MSFTEKTSGSEVGVGWVGVGVGWVGVGAGGVGVKGVPGLLGHNQLAPELKPYIDPAKNHQYFFREPEIFSVKLLQ